MILYYKLMRNKKWSYEIELLEGRLEDLQTKYNKKTVLTEKIVILKEINELHEKISIKKRKEITVFDLW